MLQTIEWGKSTEKLVEPDSDGGLIAWPDVPLMLVGGEIEPIVCLCMLWLVQHRCEGTVGTYPDAVHQWFVSLTKSGLRWCQAQFYHFEKWRSRLDQGHEPSAANPWGSAVSSFYLWAHVRGFLRYLPFGMASYGGRVGRHGKRTPAKGRKSTVAPVAELVERRSEVRIPTQHMLARSLTAPETGA